MSARRRGRQPLDQAVPMEDRMDCAPGGNPDIGVEPPHQELADLAGPQCGFSCLQRTTECSIWAGNWLA
jgi:hypothetical protein